MLTIVHSRNSLSVVQEADYRNSGSVLSDFIHNSLEAGAGCIEIAIGSQPMHGLRLGRDGIIERLEAESLTGPVGHAAIKKLPVSKGEACGTAGGEPGLFTDDVSFSEIF